MKESGHSLYVQYFGYSTLYVRDTWTARFTLGLVPVRRFATAPERLASRDALAQKNTNTMVLSPRKTFLLVKKH
jgi:hypothetical protein